MSGTVWLWVAFNLFVISMLALDLGIFHRRVHVITVKESLAWSAFWIVLALLFNVGLNIWMGHQKALEFLTGYLIERSLSMDNLFVFLLLFSYFGIDPRFQHKVLFWGILGALVMRIVFILLGIALIQKFHWVTYLLGAFLVVSGIKMGLQKEKEIHPERNPVLRILKRFFPLTLNDEGGRFFVRKAGKIFVTPLFIVLVAVESTDVVFAADSIPAILAITQDTFIVYTSNVFAILGLRALYFALAGIMPLFHLLNYGLSIILVFVGIKMLVVDVYEMSTWIALSVVMGILVVSVLASRFVPPPKEIAIQTDDPQEDEPSS